MNLDPHGLKKIAWPPRRADYSRPQALHRKVLSTIVRPARNERVMFMGAWTTLLLGLLVLPGFEIRGLAFGLIIGYWQVGRILGESSFHALMSGHPLLLLSLMVIFSGATVFFCAWLADAAGRAAPSRTILVGSILIAATWFSIDGISYEEWQRTPPIQQAMASPEVDYHPTYRDYHEIIVLPRALAGGMTGLYFAVGLRAVVALTTLAWRGGRRHIHFNFTPPTPGDDHGRANDHIAKDQ